MSYSNIVNESTQKPLSEEEIMEQAYYEMFYQYLIEKDVEPEKAQNIVEYSKYNDGKAIGFDDFNLSTSGTFYDRLMSIDAYKAASNTDIIIDDISKYLTLTEDSFDELEYDRDGNRKADENIENDSKKRFLFINGGGLIDLVSLGNPIEDMKSAIAKREHFDILGFLQEYQYGDSEDQDLYYKLMNLYDTSEDSLALGPNLKELEKIYNERDTFIPKNRNFVPDPNSVVRKLDWYVEWRVAYEINLNAENSKSGVTEPYDAINYINSFNKELAEGTLGMSEFEKIVFKAFGFDPFKDKQSPYEMMISSTIITDPENLPQIPAVTTSAMTKLTFEERIPQILEQAEISLAHAQTLASPLILDTDDNGFSTNAKTDGVYFDLDNNGFAEKTAWTSGDAFLTYDLNENGKIDNGGELFGNHTLVGEKKAADGFAALAQYDENADGIIDENDDIYHLMRLWNDDGDGVSEDGEFKTLEEMGVSSIDLTQTTPENATYTDATVSGVSNAEIADGTSRTVADFWFNVSTADTMQVYEGEFDADILAA
jgi:hypothetical protein